MTPFGEQQKGRPAKILKVYLSRSLVKGIRATGPGFDLRVEMVLRDALARGELDAGRAGVDERGPAR